MRALNGDQFKHIMECLASIKADVRLSEKRKHPRVGVRGSVAIQVVAVDASLTAPDKVTLKDLSTGGIGIMTNHGLRKGVEFIATFVHADGRILKIKYGVVVCRPVTTSLFLIGAKLIETIEEPAADSFEARLARAIA